MPSNYEYDTSNYADGNDYITPDYNNMEPIDRRPRGFEWIMLTIEMSMLPVILILNLILFIKIVINQKLRSKPWRWLVGHTSFCFILISLISINQEATFTYLKPSLISTPLCPAVWFVDAVTRNMAMVSVALLAIERFRALRLGQENEDGMSKKAVLLSLVLFWLLLALSLVFVPLILYGTAFSYTENSPGIVTCYFGKYIGHHNVVTSVILLWAFLSVLVAVIGTAVFGCRKTMSDSMKRSVMAPTLAFCLFVFFMLISELVILLGLPATYTNHIYTNLLTLMSHIAVPIIWLVTWTKNGDISWTWKNAEQQYLMEAK